VNTTPELTLTNDAVKTRKTVRATRLHPPCLNVIATLV
jgi:hypothetical protein